MKKIAFIGLGVMGFHIAGHLSNAGYCLRVYNRSENKSDCWHARFKGKKVNSVYEAAADADIVISCVGNDHDLKEVYFGESGLVPLINENKIFIDHSSVSAKLTKKINQICVEKKSGFIDAPVSGGESGAIDASLSIMVGGSSEVYRTISPVLNVYSKMHKRMGPSGYGQLSKMANQICVAGILQSLSEAIVFAEAEGLDLNMLMSVIGQGAAQSWQLDNRALTMASNDFDFGFAVDWMCKDLDIVLSEANNKSLELPLTKNIYTYYQELQQLGKGKWDTSSLVHLLRQKQTKTINNE